VIALALLTALLAGCAANRAFSRGENAARAGDWDAAVEHYRAAVQANPNRADFQIALERAMIAASARHLDQARVFEARGQIEDALREYRRSSEYDPTNRQIAGKVLEMERRLRDLTEAARPSPRSSSCGRRRGSRRSRCSTRRRASRSTSSSTMPASATS
jgi:general secretion pathway protein D